MKDVMGLIFTGENDIHLGELTSLRAVAALPIAGRYRVIDFQLSSMVHSGIKNVGVITQKNYSSLMDHIGSGHLLIPLIVLLALMFTGYTPLFAAIVAIFVTIPVSFLRRETRMDLKIIVQATVEGSRSAIGVGISCIIIGVIIGSVNMTSLGLNFGNLILRVVGDGHLFLGECLAWMNWAWIWAHRR